MSQTVANLGTYGAALDGRLGSASTADSNDPTLLEWNGQNYVYFPGGAGNIITCPDAAALDITGDLDLRVRVAPATWTPSTTNRLITKWGAAGTYSFLLSTGTTVPVFTWSNDGTAQLSRSATAAVPTAAGELVWLRVTLDVDNGAAGHTVSFYTSTQEFPTSWAALGSPVVTAGTTSIYASNSDVTFGAIPGPGSSQLVGRMYRAQVWKGIEESGGTKVLDWDAGNITGGAATSFTATTGQTLTIGRATSGRRTVAVTGSVWLFGADDYIEVDHDDILNFSTGDPFTLIAVRRCWSVDGDDVVMSKRGGTTAGFPGWSLHVSAGTADSRIRGEVSDGVTESVADSGTTTTGTLYVSALTYDGATLTSWRDGTAGTAKASSPVIAGNSFAMRLGRIGSTGTEYADMELAGAAVFRRALSSTEIASIVDYYQARVP